MTLYYEEEGALLLPLEGQKTAEAVIERALDVVTTCEFGTWP